MLCGNTHLVPGNDLLYGLDPQLLLSLPLCVCRCHGVLAGNREHAAAPKELRRAAAAVHAVISVALGGGREGLQLAICAALHGGTHSPVLIRNALSREQQYYCLMLQSASSLASHAANE